MKKKSMIFTIFCFLGLTTISYGDNKFYSTNECRFMEGSNSYIVAEFISMKKVDFKVLKSSECRNGKLHGKGTLVDIEKEAIFIGEFKNGKRYGHGRFEIGNGIAWEEGNYVNGKLEGEAENFINLKGKTFSYRGYFRNGKMDGQGEFILPMINFISFYMIGEFKNGNLYNGYASRSSMFGTSSILKFKNGKKQYPFEIICKGTGVKDSPNGFENNEMTFEIYDNKSFGKVEPGKLCYNSAIKLQGEKYSVPKGCEIAKATSTGFTVLTMFANALVASSRGDSIIDGAMKGKELAEKERWINGIKYICD